MGDSVEHVHSLCPITALSFLDDGDNILLAGEGPILKVFSVDKQALLATARIFKSQPIHGIISEECENGDHGRRRLVIWGGFLVQIAHLVVKEDCIHIRLGLILEAPGWVLDGRFAPSQVSEAGSAPLEARVALVTARNALLFLQVPEDIHQSRLDVLSGSRHSILYSARIKWIAIDRILLASGTAFGEIIIWSCILKQLPEKPLVRQHQILRGHEGSVFGVDISEQLSSLDSNSEKRLLASCSDDRTIRIWDISNAYSKEGVDCEPDDTLQPGPRETGFQPEIQAMSANRIPKDLLTMAWAHASRIWGIRFMHHGLVTGGVGIGLLSFGEDATCQHWRLSWSGENLSLSPSCSTYQFALEHQSTRSYHAGRNIWSMAIAKSLQGNVLVATGGADGKIACFTVKTHVSTVDTEHCVDTVSSKSLLDTLSVGPAERDREPDKQAKDASLVNEPPTLAIDQNLNHSADRKEETAPKLPNSGWLSAESGDDPIAFKFLRSYSLIDGRRLLAVTDAGTILVISCKETGRDNMTATLLNIDRSANVVFNKSDFTYVQVASSDAFRSHSIINTCRLNGISFLAAADGAIYYFLHKEQRLGQLEKVSGKVSYMLCKESSDSIHIVISCVHAPKLTYVTFRVRALVDSDHECLPERSRQIELPCNVVITSMAVLDSHDLLILGSRTGAVLMYDLLVAWEGSPKETMSVAACFKRIHAEDAVTSISSVPQVKDGFDSPSPLILTTGRNGRYAIHEITYNRTFPGSILHVDMITVHELSVVSCPTIEGVYFNKSKHLVMYGFLSKHFIVWNESTQSEVFKVECGGVHRIWNFFPTTHGGRFVWTKASKVYLHIQTQMAHYTLQHGTHGREIKAMSISPPIELAPGEKFQLMATGAEDTRIEISVYERLFGDCQRHPFTDQFSLLALICRHTTGIQALQWSQCGTYLFSSGGCEEFFVWRVHPLCVEVLRVGITCEAVCPKQSAMSDTRITSFCTSVLRTGSWSADGPTAKFVISMAYSNSFVRVFEYDCVHKSFTLLLQGTYMSCSMTNVHHTFLGNDMILCTTSSDGYLAWWNVTKPLGTKGVLTQDGHLEELGLREEGEPEQITWLDRVDMHQSSVKCMTVISVNSDLACIVTGGDDSAIGLVVLYMEEDHSIFWDAWAIQRPHVGAVTAITRLPFIQSCHLSGSSSSSSLESQSDAGVQLHRYRFATIGDDQDLSIWHLTVNPDPKKKQFPCFREHASVETDVADVSSMEVMECGPGDPRVVMCGIGRGNWRIRDLSYLRGDNCPYEVTKKECLCSANGFSYCS